MNELDPYSWSELGGIILVSAFFYAPIAVSQIREKIGILKARRQMRELRHKYQDQ